MEGNRRVLAHPGHFFYVWRMKFDKLLGSRETVGIIKMSPKAKMKFLRTFVMSRTISRTI